MNTGKQRKDHYFHKCPHCGAALDPGERCDCMDRVYRGTRHATVNPAAYRAKGERCITT